MWHLVLWGSFVPDVSSTCGCWHVCAVQRPALPQILCVSFGEESDLEGVWASEDGGLDGGAPGMLAGGRWQARAGPRLLGLEDELTLLQGKPLTEHELTRAGGCAEDTQRGSHGGGAGTQASCLYRPSGVSSTPVRLSAWRH